VAHEVAHGLDVNAGVQEPRAEAVPEAMECAEVLVDLHCLEELARPLAETEGSTA